MKDKTKHSLLSREKIFANSISLRVNIQNTPKASCDSTSKEKKSTLTKYRQRTWRKINIFQRRQTHGERHRKDAPAPLILRKASKPEQFTHLTCQTSIIKKTTNNKDVDKREPLCTVVRTVNWCSCYGEQYRGPSKN